MANIERIELHRGGDTVMEHWRVDWCNWDIIKDKPQAIADCKAILKDGYIIMENVVPPEMLKEAQNMCDQEFAKCGKGSNAFLGFETRRIHNLVSKGRVFENLATLPRVTDVLDAFLQPGYLLSVGQGINIGPNSAPQPLHFDDSNYPLPRPRAPMQFATVIAIDDFTPTNGATVVLPGSHTWGQNKTPPDHLRLRKGNLGYGSGTRDAIVEKKEDDLELISAVMPAGSLVLFSGTLWHGGGKNVSSGFRRSVTYQYINPYLRQLENSMHAIPWDRVKTMEPKMQSLLGYSVRPPFIGHIEGQHPIAWELAREKREGKREKAQL
eukprot:Clim_evm12s35 gene=Clim_evmTU12s35